MSFGKKGSVKKDKPETKKILGLKNNSTYKSQEKASEW